MTKAKKFPHNTRIISAPFLNYFYLCFKYLAIGLIVTLTYVNFYTEIFPENQEYVNLKLQTYITNRDHLAYTRLALYLERNGLERQAYENFRIAQNLFNYQSKENTKPQANILGEQNSPFSLYQELQKQKKLIASQADYWKKITEEKPDYRDAYLQLGASLYKLGHYDLSKIAIYKAFEIDPLYPNKKLYLNLISKI